MPKNWILCSPDPLLQKQFSDAFEIHPVIAQVLVNRHLYTSAAVKMFLNPALEGLFNPFLLTDMDRVVDRLHLAQERSEKVLIYGDYDVDGVTSSVLVHRLLKRMGIEVVHYIPHRVDEGYGLNIATKDYAKEQGVSLVIAIDCGINAYEPIAQMKAQGLDVIVIDHHQPDANKPLPHADAIINPKRLDCLYPFKHLCAAGLAGKLIQAVMGTIPSEDLDLIAIGTIADVMPLVGENRIFALHGLNQLSKTTNLGLRALLDLAKISGKKIKPYYIGFIIAPRLNAAGRIDSAHVALELLLCDDEKKAITLAQQLESLNQSRQQMQVEVVNEALSMIEQQQYHQHAVIVIEKEGWHKGVLGIVASRIVEKYYRPTIVISVHEGVGVGSARSIEGFHLHEALSSCGHMLQAFGGHKKAAGLTVKQEDIDLFRQAINNIAQDKLSKESSVPSLYIDVDLPFSSIDLDLVNKVVSLNPFGEGNPNPLFCSRRLTIKAPVQLMGKDTLKCWLTDGQKTFTAVGFGMASNYKELRQGSVVDVAYHLDIDDWQKLPTVQLTLKDMKVVE